MTFWTRSAGIVDCVWETGIVPPGLITGPELPGLQSMKYSPISDSGRESQVASVWNWPKPALLIWTVTTAWRDFWSSRSYLIVPAGTPATLKSAPVTRPKALSSSIL